MVKTEVYLAGHQDDHEVFVLNDKQGKHGNFRWHFTAIRGRILPALEFEGKERGVEGVAFSTEDRSAILTKLKQYYRLSGRAELSLAEASSDVRSICDKIKKFHVLNYHDAQQQIHNLAEGSPLKSAHCSIVYYPDRILIYARAGDLYVRITNSQAKGVAATLSQYPSKKIREGEVPLAIELPEDKAGIMLDNLLGRAHDSIETEMKRLNRRLAKS